MFDNATAPAMWTLPTHATMFTGRYPHHPRRPRGLPVARSAPPGRLSELLGGAGYDTFWFTSNVIAGPMTNLTQGFDVVHTTYPGKSGKRYVKAARKAHPRQAHRHRRQHRDLAGLRRQQG